MQPIGRLARRSLSRRSVSVSASQFLIPQCHPPSLPATPATKPRPCLVALTQSHQHELSGSSPLAACLATAEHFTSRLLALCSFIHSLATLLIPRFSSPPSRGTLSATPCPGTDHDPFLGRWALSEVCRSWLVPEALPGRFLHDCSRRRRFFLLASRFPTSGNRSSCPWRRPAVISGPRPARDSGRFIALPTHDAVRSPSMPWPALRLAIRTHVALTSSFAPSQKPQP